MVPEYATAQTAGPTFTVEQAARGEALYRHSCQDCHGSELDNGEFGGPPLTGTYFSDHWGAGNVAALYSFTKAMMPPDRPGDLSPQTYVDLTAFILSRNGYKAGGKELSADLDALAQMSLKK
jgi:cytochrome c